MEAVIEESVELILLLSVLGDFLFIFYIVICKAVSASRHVYLILDRLVREIKIQLYLPICCIWRGLNGIL